MFVRFAMRTVAAVAENVQQRAQQKQHERQRPQQMCLVLAEQEKSGDRQETDQRQAGARHPPARAPPSGPPDHRCLAFGFVGSLALRKLSSVLAVRPDARHR
jgi:hypothetical protein